VDGQGPFHL